MNVLDDRLSHSNSAVVMATVKLFLHYTLTMPATHQQVHSRTCIQPCEGLTVCVDRYKSQNCTLCNISLLPTSTICSHLHYSNVRCHAHQAKVLLHLQRCMQAVMGTMFVASQTLL